MPGDIWQCLEILLVVTPEGRVVAVLLASKVQSPGILLDILQCTGFPTAKDYPSENANSVEVKKL